MSNEDRQPTSAKEARMSELSPELLRKILRYNPETGDLTWKEREPSTFVSNKYSAERICAAWNKKFSGKKAFNCINSAGYFVGAINSKKYLAHRVAWFLHFGSWPNEIDHINGDTTDNRLSNLRNVTHSENLKNQKLSARNTSGATGVIYDKSVFKWHVRIRVDNVTRHVGSFYNFDDAVIARKEAEIKHGYHENHGRLK